MNFFSRLPLGSPDELPIFGTVYFIALVLALLGLYISNRYLPLLKDSKIEVYIRIAIAVYLIYTSININSYYIRNHDPWYIFIPEGTCGFAVGTSIVTLFTKSKLFFKITFFWGWGAFFALFAPNIIEGPRFYYFYQFYLRHMLIIITALYMMRVFDYKIFRSDYKIYVLITLPMALLGLLADYIIHDPSTVNIMYMMVPAIWGTPLDLLYNIHPLFYSSCWVAIAFLFGYGYGLPFYQKDDQTEIAYS